MNIFLKTKNVLKDSVLELKKVHWPTRKEAVALTWAVIVVSVFFALILGFMDFGLGKFIYKFIFK